MVCYTDQTCQRHPRTLPAHTNKSCKSLAALNPPTPPHPPHARQVIGLCEKKRDPPLSHIILDTPGQIEIFTWSASGQIVTECFASSFPTMVA